MELDSEFKTGAAVRQGDLVGFWDWHRRPALDRFGVIITADCDIEHGRPDQELVYLRIIAQSDYVDVFWSRRKLETARAQAFGSLVPQINRLRREQDPCALDLTPAEVQLWLSSSTANDIADAIGVHEHRERLKLISNAEQTKTIIALANAPLGSSCLENLIRFRNQQRHDALRQAANDLRSDRNELFFLTGITDSVDKSGYYVLLDQIGAVRRDQITDSIDAVANGAKAAYRFGTLAKTYKYAIAQRFAFLFQRIGLPNDYDERHYTAVTNIASLARLEHRLDMRGWIRQPVEVGQRDGPLSIAAAQLDRRIEGNQRDCEVRGVRGYAIVAAPEHGMPAVLAADGGAA